MCGIAGIFRYGAGPGEVDQDELRAMRDYMTSRGPDGSGSWISEDRRVALAHRRLAVIGLGSQGAQPMELATGCEGRAGGLAITFNGEIYNHRELRRELSAHGHTFRTACDTEVLLHLYEEEGAALVARLRGMFAFAIWDQAAETLLLVRDPFGIKPLYYSNSQGMFRFASQARAILAGRAVPTTPDDGSLAAFFVFGNVPEPRTSWAAVRALEAGTTMKVDLRGHHVPQRYFRLGEALQSSIARHPDSDIRAVLAGSVQAHLTADVPVGIFLSAGVDSGALLGLSSELSTDRVRAVTLAFAEFRGSSNDESLTASVVAAHYGAHHSIDVISSSDFLCSISSIFRSMDQPTADGINTWFVSRAASNAGLKVAISGVGGDELLGGYSTFDSVRRWHRRLRWTKSIPRLARASRTVGTMMIPNGMSPKLAGIIEYGGSIDRIWLLRRAVFMPWEISNLLGDDRAEAALEALDVDGVLQMASVGAGASPLTQVAALESNLYMRNQLLRDADWASMAHSLEVRVPLVDVPVLLASTRELVFHGTPRRPKDALATAPSRPLPVEARRRSKTGFSIPMANWIESLPDDIAAWRSFPQVNFERSTWARRWVVAVASQFQLL
ncbi:MAG TPA: asparagine synthase (glutamine-hydrolyzing) [Acidimicrobiales bacterium]|nr:asparagine synthase (glutamine-hydrolyzing) [Acidimicrobiales bacterium]